MLPQGRISNLQLVLYFPKGTYLVSETLQLYINVTDYGNGKSPKVLCLVYVWCIPEFDGAALGNSTHNCRGQQWQAAYSLHR